MGNIFLKMREMVRTTHAVEYRHNDKVKTVYILAESGNEAGEIFKRDFDHIMHDKGHTDNGLICISPVEGALSEILTPDIERDAVRLIGRIIDLLGKDSHVAPAFTGVIQIALNNIYLNKFTNLYEELSYKVTEQFRLKDEIENLKWEINRLKAEIYDLHSRARKN